MATASINPALAASEPLPNKPNGVRDFDVCYTGNVGNDMGISTMGYRSQKYNPPEWHEHNYSKYYQSFANLHNAENTRHEGNRTIKETDAHTVNTQNDVTKKLAERSKDINFWKIELEREISDLISETDMLVDQRKRLELALRSTEIPLHISTDNLNCRARRQGIDLVQDPVELNLLKEVEVINNVQDLLKRTIKETDEQIKRNRDRKRELEMDWSDKKEAFEIDTAMAGLRNEHTNKQFYAGSAQFQAVQSTPESWAQFTHDNITRAEHERMASIQLRSLVDNVLQDTSRDMREQADAVDVSFKKRTDEVDDALHKLKDNLRKVSEDIVTQQKKIGDLKKKIKEKEDPMKVAQTRLHSREYRPGVELCRDPVQYALVNEVHEIAGSVDSLMQRLNDAENGLKDLQDNRMLLEKEISIKKNTLFIDREKCMTTRTRYPSTLQLQGYQGPR